MTEQEKNAFENEIREKIAAEKRAKQRAYKAEWREKNREHIRQYNKVYRMPSGRGGMHSDPTAKAAERLHSQSVKAAELRHVAERECWRLEQALDIVPAGTEKQIMLMRFLERKPWHEIGDAVFPGGDRTTDCLRIRVRRYCAQHPYWTLPQGEPNPADANRSSLQNDADML